MEGNGKGGGRRRGGRRTKKARGGYIKQHSYLNDQCFTLIVAVASVALYVSGFVWYSLASIVTCS